MMGGVVAIKVLRPPQQRKPGSPIPPNQFARPPQQPRGRVIPAWQFARPPQRPS